MDIQMLNNYFYKYGGIVIFVIVFLEYLNIPGFPSGVIMPLAGIWASKGNIGFGAALFLSVVAGLCGSWILYFIGRYGGDLLIKKYVKRFPKQKTLIDQTIKRVRTKGYIGIFFGKLIPMIRTIISIPAGALKIDFVGYTLFSTMGIFIWNLVFIGAGYFLGQSVLQIFK